MLNKIYFLALTIAAVIMIVLSYLAYNQIQAIGFSPATIAGNFHYYESLYQQFLWISSLILLILGNVLLWQTRRSRALWATLLYFVVFVLLDSWWLGSLGFDYEQRYKLTVDSFSFSGILGAGLCIVAALIIFFDHFIVLRMRDRIHGAPPSGTNVIAGEIPPIERK
ncbi:MAG: hypothetical protein ACR2L1_09265 [Pyrinomonadaceae bacterium]